MGPNPSSPSQPPQLGSSSSSFFDIYPIVDVRFKTHYYLHRLSSMAFIVYHGGLWLQSFAGWLYHLLRRTMRRARRLVGLGQADSPLPGDTSVSARWLESLLQSHGLSACKGVRLSNVSMSKMSTGGFAGAMFKVDLSYAVSSESASAGSSASASSLPRTLVMKTYNAGSVAQRFRLLAMNSYREARAYQMFSQLSSLSTAASKAVRFSCMPLIYHAAGSAWTGETEILMEDLVAPAASTASSIAEQGTTSTGPGVGVNMFFGNQCWGMSAPVLRPRDPAAVIMDIFTVAADIHSPYWMDTALKTGPEFSWLKARRWYAGRDRDSWEEGLLTAKLMWEKAKTIYGPDAPQKAVDAGDATAAVGKPFRFDPVMVGIMDRSMAASTWENLQKLVSDPSIPFTLTHGDLHAQNMIWRYKHSEAATSSSTTGNDEGHLYLVDWSECGIWENTCELSQMMISDVRPEVRRSCEAKAVRAYWDRLVQNGVSAAEYPFENCWKNYTIYGVQKWMWFLAYMSGYFGIPEVMVKYFHDQIFTFIADHHPADQLGSIVFPITALCTVPAS